MTWKRHENRQVITMSTIEGWVFKSCMACITTAAAGTFWGVWHFGVMIANDHERLDKTEWRLDRAEDNLKHLNTKTGLAVVRENGKASGE